jgi:hypothetical protein
MSDPHSTSRARQLARTSSAAALCTVIFGVGLGTPANAKHLAKGNDKGACAEVAADTHRSCRAGALDDYWIAIAKCDNADDEDRGPDPCEADAHQALKSAYQDCSDQRAARNDICDALGGGPYEPQIDPARFGPNLTNPLLAFKVGRTFHYRTDLGGGDVETDDVTITSDTRTLLGVRCRAVHDVVRTNGDVTEDTIDWYAQDAAGNVWYFGEESKQLEDGVLVGIEGSWRAGVDGALPGIAIEAGPRTGDFYRQEYAIGDAEDVAEVVALGQSVTVPAGSFSNAVETEETSGLEPSALEHKFYVSGVGQVLTVDEETGQREELIGVTP